MNATFPCGMAYFAVNGLICTLRALVYYYYMVRRQGSGVKAMSYMQDKDQEI